MPTIHETLQQAVQLQTQGQLDQAAQLYQLVLQSDPNQPDALHLLGLVANAKKQYGEAVEYIEKAIALNPSPIFFGNLGVAYRFAGRIEDAIAAYRKALESNPNTSDTHFNLGKSLKIAGDLEGAESAFQRAIELEPGKPSPWLSLMNLVADQQDVEAGIQLGLRALQACPRSHELHMNLAVMLKRANQATRALQHLRTAVEIAPHHVEALCRLATTLIGRHELEEGQRILARAQAIAPQSSHVLNACGTFYNTTGDFSAAAKAFSRSVELYPDNSTAFTNLGISLKGQGRLSEALASIDRGLEMDRERAEALVNRGAILMTLGKLDEARESFRGAIEARDGYADAHDSLLMCLQYATETENDNLLAEHRRWNQLYAASIEPLPALDRASRAAPDGRIRLGFVSADLGKHPVGYFSLPLFENLDSSRFHVSVFSDRIGDDAIATRIQSLVDKWENTAAKSDEELAEFIQGENIDILFDLAGHTAHNRLLAFARRPAPVQVTWAGYVGTTGLDCMDFLLADPFHVPDELQDNHSEKILRMPNDYICYSPPDNAPDVTKTHAVEAGWVQFAVVANPAKVNPQCLHVWCQILKQVPNSRLLLCYNGWPDPGNQSQAKTVEPMGCADRIDFEQQLGHERLLQRYLDVDVALDTFPYSGGLTTCEALWMGVPTITLPGDRFASRHSLSHLSNSGYSEWVATSWDEYTEKAVSLATDIPRLTQLRGEMRAKVAVSPLCDGLRFANDFAELMDRTWNQQKQDRL